MTYEPSSSIAIVGAGPVGLALGLLAARTLPATVQITLFDTRPVDKDVSADPRTLALSLGSVQLLQRLGCWPAAAAQAIHEVRVSQQPPSTAPWSAAWADGPTLHIRASEEGVPMLGAVLSYGQITAALQAAWMSAAAEAPQRLRSAFGRPVAGLAPERGGVTVDAGIVERFDLAVVAEGGVFADQARKAVRRDYGQAAWVGTLALSSQAGPGVAYERFTRHGPVALLPLRDRRAALVWCVDSADDPVAELDDRQRLAVLQSILPAEVGPLSGLSPLKRFELGLNAERTLREGRCIRIGNAAQTLHPVAGQGLNLGLRDAWELVQALRRHADVDTALQRLEWQRAPDRWAMIAATDFLARSFTWKLPGAGAVRGLGLAALQAFRPARSALARQMMFGSR